MACENVYRHRTLRTKSSGSLTEGYLGRHDSIQKQQPIPKLVNGILFGCTAVRY